MFPWLILFYIKGPVYAYKLEALDYLGAIGLLKNYGNVARHKFNG
jgi:hypothetical protein